MMETACTGMLCCLMLQETTAVELAKRDTIRMCLIPENSVAGAHIIYTAAKFSLPSLVYINAKVDRRRSRSGAKKRGAAAASQLFAIY